MDCSWCWSCDNVLVMWSGAGHVIRCWSCDNGNIWHFLISLCVIPYSAHNSRVFNFANFANLESFVKWFQRKFWHFVVEPHWQCALAKLLQRNLRKKNSYSRKFWPVKYKCSMGKCWVTDGSQFTGKCAFVWCCYEQFVVWFFPWVPLPDVVI